MLSDALSVAWSPILPGPSGGEHPSHGGGQPRNSTNFRKVIVKSETSRRGFNTRYVVTSLRGCSAEWLYDHRYCARGEMENRIKEQQFLFSDRTSCHEWWPNQYRLLLSGLAYLLLERLRRVYLKRTAFAQAQVNTLRLKLLKIGAVITRNTRTIRLMLSSQYPEQDLFLKLASKLVPG